MSTENQDRGDELLPEDKKDELPPEDKKDELPPEDKKGELPPEDKKDDEEPPRDDKGRFIPVSRHKDVLEKERQRADTAERKLAELSTQLSDHSKSIDVQKLEGEIAVLEEKHAQALLDGDKTAATQAMKEIRHKERDIARAEAETLSDRKSDQAVEKMRFDTAVERLEGIYAQLNPADEAYDEDLVNLVLASQRQLVELDRMRPADALVEAAKKVMNKFAPPKEDDGKEKKGLAQAKERSDGQKTKNVDAATRQPADLKDVGKDSDKGGMKEKVDVTRLSEEEFSALPATTRARLRGDLI